MHLQDLGVTSKLESGAYAYAPKAPVLSSDLVSRPWVSCADDLSRRSLKEIDGSTTRHGIFTDSHADGEDSSLRTFSEYTASTAATCWECVSAYCVSSLLSRTTNSLRSGGPVAVSSSLGSPKSAGYLCEGTTPLP
ncbi:hypothetical protein PIB30_082275 [Stylosanthes scabra]|uniref:Uncharacterized protein n=1 Tax=Stylosanthes scabra TaxID=79078 RepID=A0ABU6WQ81_9FABA|nr:hypothetical protein [Stylosanthes scabra]